MLLKVKAFIVKKIEGCAPKFKKNAAKQITWKKNGGAAAAWELTKVIAHWPEENE